MKLPASIPLLGVTRKAATAGSASSLGSSAGMLGKLSTVSPWVALGILAFLTGGHLDQNVSDTIDSKTRNKLIDYLHGDNTSEDALKVLTGEDEKFANSVGLHGILDPLTTSILTGTRYYQGTGDAFQGFAKGASGLLTGGISGIVDFYQNQARQQELDKIRNGINVDDFKDFSANELEALLDYYTDNSGFWFFNRDDIDEDAFLRDYNDYLKWKEEVGPMPEDIDYDALYAAADSSIDREANLINQIYDDTLEDTKNIMNQALEENSAAFQDYRSQVLTNDAMNQQAIAGATRYELDRQQRNAISRGASAAQRLVTNINTSLGMQAQSAQHALDTSNVLAQQLLNYRTAQSNIRSGYANAVAERGSQRAALMNGMFERKQAARSRAGAEAKQRYNDAMEQWERKINSYGGSSPFVDFYRNSQYRNNSGKSTYGYSI